MLHFTDCEVSTVRREFVVTPSSQGVLQIVRETATKSKARTAEMMGFQGRPKLCCRKSKPTNQIAKLPVMALIFLVFIIFRISKAKGTSLKPILVVNNLGQGW